MTGSVSGYWRTNQAGGEAVAVARSTAMPRLSNRSISRSSQAKSHSFSAGCSRAQENTPSVTIVTPASRIRLASCFQTDSGHCSGL